MKKIIGFMLVAMMSVSCDSKLDITPSDKTTLDTVSDLETLLNQPWCISTGATDLEVLSNNTYPNNYKTVEAMLTNKNTVSYALLACDESVKRAPLTIGNLGFRYDQLYKYIQYANIIISKAPDAAGDEKLRQRIIAEAHVLRAWLHFLLVNIYAGQYDESTAENEGGVPYVDNTNAQELKVKRSVAYVYEQMLKDCSDEYIAAMPQKRVENPWRGGADFGNAVRALILFQMKRYGDALEYAQRALDVNDIIEDRNKSLSSGSWTVDYMAENNYLLIRGNNSNLGIYSGFLLTPEAAALIEPNDLLRTFDDEHGGWNMNPGYGTDGSFQSSGSGVHITAYGIRTENVIYTAAECLIRTGRINDGLKMVDRVRAKRIGGYEPFAERTDVSTEAQAMKLLQDAKRVEMFATCYNYLDLKRWNSEENYRRTITRDLGDAGTVQLRPDSPLWIFPFPVESAIHNPTLTPNYE